MTNENLSCSGLQRALKSVYRRLPRNSKPALTLSCHVTLYVVAMNIRSAISISSDDHREFSFRIRLRTHKRGWMLSARNAGRTITFESSKDV